LKRKEHRDLSPEGAEIARLMTPEMKKTWKYTAAVFHPKDNASVMKIMEKAAKEAAAKDLKASPALQDLES